MKNNSAYMIPASSAIGAESDISFNSINMDRHHFETSPSIYKKRWTATIIKSVSPKKKPIQFNSRDHVLMKIEAGKTKIEGKFLEAEHIFSKALSQNNALPATGEAEQTWIRDFVGLQIDTLWMNCAKDYASACALSYFDGFYTAAASGAVLKGGKADIAAINDGLADSFKTIIQEVTEAFEAQNKSLKDRLIENGFSYNPLKQGIDIFKPLASIFKRVFSKLIDETRKVSIKASLAGIRAAGFEMYTFVCENPSTACERCAALNGQHFALADVEEGVNLPPIHPNCKCRIQAYDSESDTSRDIGFQDVWPKIQEELVQLTINSITDNFIGVVLGQPIINMILPIMGLVGSSRQDYFNTFTTIDIDGVEYRINRDTFAAVAVTPDGELICPENASRYDEQLLNLMRRRDELPAGSAERKEIEAEIKWIKATNNEIDDYSVVTDRPYSYYVLGGDVTEQLNEHMRQTEIDYSYMHERAWAQNLWEFYNLVRGGAIMDLKNQPEWQNSAFIYDGEIVDQDVLGNINFGYFGVYCNIPVLVLLAGGGFAQIRAGSSELDFWFSFFDDPRDSYRVMQGVTIYNRWH